MSPEKIRREGVFCIFNEKTQKNYFGHSRNVDAVWRDQRAKLRCGWHVNEALQKDFTDQNGEGFKFWVVSVTRVPGTSGWDCKQYVAGLKPWVLRY